MSGLTYLLYENLGAYFLHMDGACEPFHRRGERCPCEYWQYVGVVGLPEGYFVSKVAGFVDTGFVVSHNGQDYTVVALE